MMRTTYIYSKSCQCSCSSSGQGSRGHTLERPTRPAGERREEMVNKWAMYTAGF